MIEPSTYQECIDERTPFVGVIQFDEFDSNSYGMDFDGEFDMDDIHNSKLEVNFNTLSGTFCIPDRRDMDEHILNCAFILDKSGILFIENGHRVQGIIEDMRRSRRRMNPSLERFLYDFLEYMIDDDLRVLETYGDDMELIEEHILDGEFEGAISALTHIRNELRMFWIHYEELIDIGEKLKENENEFFDVDNLRYFQLFEERVDRRQNLVNSLRDHTSQIRDLYQSQLEVQQTHTMNYLTIVTTIFLPLTLIVGWYGMNFKYMPELTQKWGYPGVIIASLLIVVISLVFFKKKNLL